jgi:uncharacterized protein (TIGR03382 family)
MEGGLIWLTTIGAIIVLAAVIVGVGAALRRRRRTMK